MKVSLLILAGLSGLTAFSQSTTAAQRLSGDTNALCSAATLSTNVHCYLVKSGDTDAIIARKFGMSRKALLAANPDVPLARLKVGQALVIPAANWPATNAAPRTVAQAADPPKPLPVTTPYVVGRGDTAKRIAKKQGISLSALLAANPGLDTTRIKAGQVLAIPPKPARPTRASKKS